MSDANNEYCINLTVPDPEVEDTATGDGECQTEAPNDDDSGGGGEEKDQVGELPTVGVKRKREGKPRSVVWKHFSKVTVKLAGGKEKTIAKCNHCSKTFAIAKSGGTTHMLRHINDGICPSYRKTLYANKEVPAGQIMLTSSYKISDQSSTWVTSRFDQLRSRADLAEFIVERELPFNIVECPVFRKFVLGLNNKFKFVGRNTIKSDIMKRFELEMDKLKDLFSRNKSAVCLTSDTWTSKNNLPFLALTAHFIDDDWKLHKKIINFVLVPCKASGENLCDIITGCLLEWNIEKICTITLDNASANDVVIDCFRESQGSEGMLVCDGRNLHVRCWGHVLNLIVQEGLDEIKESIQKVRDAVKYVKASSKRKLAFLDYADQERIPRGKMLVLDVCTRWNSTYLMLVSALHFRKAYDRMRTRDVNFKDAPTVLDWEKAKIVHDFLETFYDVTKIFSGSHYCTANVFFKEASRILISLRKSSVEGSPLIRDMASSMLKKFEKYWVDKKPNMLFAVAVVLDPRFKLFMLKFVYNKMYSESEVPRQLNIVMDELHSIFFEYSAKYELSMNEESNVEGGSGNDFGGNGSVLSGGDASFLQEFVEFTKEEEKCQTKSELDIYLEEKLYKVEDSSYFDVLNYWKGESVNFPILSSMAKDILAIPVSSVASESAFSTGGRVLSAYRSSLLPSTVEALICMQDWLRGDRQSDVEELEEFDSAFAALTISKK